MVSEPSQSVWGGALVLALVALGSPAQAQDSIPFDTDVANDPPAAEARSEDLPDLSLPVPSAPPESSLESVPTPSREAVAPGQAIVDFASFLMGQDVDAVVSALEQDGWVVVTRTPQLVELDRGQQGINLDIEGTTGAVVTVEVVDLP
ncbi:MAG: hypothetical protein ACFCVD_21145 [Nodosilinea sp.]